MSEAFQQPTSPGSFIEFKKSLTEMDPALLDQLYTEALGRYATELAATRGISMSELHELPQPNITEF